VSFTSADIVVHGIFVYTIGSDTKDLKNARKDIDAVLKFVRTGTALTDVGLRYVQSTLRVVNSTFKKILNDRNREFVEQAQRKVAGLLGSITELTPTDDANKQWAVHSLENVKDQINLILEASIMGTGNPLKKVKM